MSQIFDIVEELEKERKKNKELEIELKDNKDRCEILAYRIDKAIEYVEKYKTEDYCDGMSAKQLLDILKGEDK